MINPYDSKKNSIQFISKFKLPTFYGSRDNNLNVQCGLLSNMKRNIIINQHTFRTNGVGITPLPNYTTQIPATANSIKINNIIYLIPKRFCKYIDIIRTQSEQNISLSNIFKNLTTEFNIPDPYLSNIQPSNLKNKYTFPPFNKLYKTYNNVGNFSGPFKMGGKISEVISDFQIPLDDLFPIYDETRYVFVSCNDGKNYTDKITDMANNGIASFWGSRLSLHGNDLGYDIKIPVAVFPIDDTTNIIYGTFFTSFVSNKILFIPLTTLQDFPIHKNYYENMLFNIKTYDCYENISIDYNKVKCIYTKHVNLYTNYI